MLGTKKHARCFPEVPGNGRCNARYSMFGTKMLGAHVRHRGFPLKKRTKWKISYNNILYNKLKQFTWKIHIFTSFQYLNRKNFLFTNFYRKLSLSLQSNFFLEKHMFQYGSHSMQMYIPKSLKNNFWMKKDVINLEASWLW